MRLFLALFFAVLCGSSAASAQKQPVDLMLVLASDVSQSVDTTEFQLQREGYAAAIKDPRVIMAATSREHKRIAVIFMEWAGEKQQKIVVDWTVIDGAKSASAFAESLLHKPRAFTIGHTSIGMALQYSSELLEDAPFVAPRRIIDVSGDGTSNQGPFILKARDAVLKKGITINGLVIISPLPSLHPLHTHPDGGLDMYYRNHVIGGDGAFVLAAKGFESFADAILRKMILEIAMK